jgi:hypothetical protein
MVKYLLLFLSLFSLAKASDAQTNCRSECVASGKSHICQWETVCDPVTPTPEPAPSPTPEPAPLPPPQPTPEPAPLPAPITEPTSLPPTPLPQPTPEPYPLPLESVSLPPQSSQPPETISVPSILNPTNPLSILNPNSPLKPPTVPLQIPQSQTNMVGNDAQESSAPQPTAQTNAEETPNGKTFVPGFGLVLSLELMVKPRIVQPNLFPDQYIGQEMPNDYKYQMHDLYDVGDPNTFSRLTKDAVELEQ